MIDLGNWKVDMPQRFLTAKGAGLPRADGLDGLFFDGAAFFVDVKEGHGMGGGRNLAMGAAMHGQGRAIVGTIDGQTGNCDIVFVQGRIHRLGDNADLLIATIDGCAIAGRIDAVQFQTPNLEPLAPF